MSKRNTRLYLEDILESIERVEKWTKGVTPKSFNQDDKLQHAVVRCLEIIGEASKNVPRVQTVPFPLGTGL